MAANVPVACLHLIFGHLRKAPSEILAVWPARSTYVSGKQSLPQWRCTALGKQSLSTHTPTVRRTSAGLRRIYATTGVEIDPSTVQLCRGHDALWRCSSRPTSTDMPGCGEMDTEADSTLIVFHDYSPGGPHTCSNARTTRRLPTYPSLPVYYLLPLPRHIPLLALCRPYLAESILG